MKNIVNFQAKLIFKYKFIQIRNLQELPINSKFVFRHMSQSRQTLQPIQVTQQVLGNIGANNQANAPAPGEQSRLAQVLGGGRQAPQTATEPSSRQAYLRQHLSNGGKARPQNQLSGPDHAQLHHQYKSPIFTKTKSIGSAALAPSANALVGIAAHITPYDKAGKIVSGRHHERRKHASPNQRYQNVPTEADMLELLAENSAQSNEPGQTRFGEAPREENRGVAGAAYDPRDLVPVRLGSGYDGVATQKKGKYSTSQAEGRQAGQAKGVGRARSGMKTINVQLAGKMKGMESLERLPNSERSPEHAEAGGQWAFSVYVRIRPHPKVGQKQRPPLVQMHVRGQANQILQVIEPYDRHQVHQSPARGPDQEGQHSFLFEGVFGETQNNLDVFQAMLQPLIPQLLDGYNVTCFAYGQTGSGKTHTMLGQFPRGKAGPEPSNDPMLESDEEKFARLKDLGISNLAIQNLFYQMYERQGDVAYTVRVSYLEIYNEQVHDLLADLREYSEPAKPVDRGGSTGQERDHKGLRKQVRALLAQDSGDQRQRTDSFLSSDGLKAFTINGLKKDTQKKTLKIVEDPQRGVVVQDLQEIPVEEASELMDLILLGNMRRCVAHTGANRFSSRSHALLIFNIEGQEKLSDGQRPTAHREIKIVRSKLQIIDLAGSERASGTQNTGQRLVEGGNINKSLMALGQCINMLAEQSKRAQAKGQSSRSRSNNQTAVKPHQFATQLEGVSSNPSSPKGGHSKRFHIPYRDSKLTRLLKDSLGGSTKTVMIACISQVASCYEETMNTIKYASQAKSILNQKKKNEIILQEYNREEEMRRLAALAEQEKLERQKMEEAMLKEIRNMKRGKGANEEGQMMDTERRELEVPTKVKKEIEKITVINLSKLESKLTAQRPVVGSTKAHLMSLLSQQFIPNIVRQYNLRHQIQSNQILIDFQTQNEDPAAQSDQASAIKQIKSLQQNLEQAQATQTKIQNEILDIFDQLECSTAPTKPSKEDQELQSMQTTINAQSSEIANLKGQLSAQQQLVARQKADARRKTSDSRDKDERQKMKEELRSLELIVKDKNVEIEMLKLQEEEKQKQLRGESQAVMEENEKLKQLVRNLERQVATQAQKLQAKDVLLEGLKRRTEKTNDQAGVDRNDGAGGQGQLKAQKTTNTQLSKFTNKEKGQTKALQKHKQSVVEQSYGIKMEQFYDGKQASEVADHSLIQDHSNNEAQTQSQLVKKQRTLKRYLSGVRVESCEAVMKNAEDKPVDKSSKAQRHTTRKPAEKDSSQVLLELHEGNKNMSLDLTSKEHLSQHEQRLNTLPEAGACDMEGEPQEQYDLGLNRPPYHEKSAELTQRVAAESKPLLVQDLPFAGRQRDLGYPKLRQSANNSRFQRNLQPRSHSRVSRSRGAPTNNNSRSRSNFSRADLRFKRSHTNLGISSHESLPRCSKNNSGLGQWRQSQVDSVLIPNATEINVRRPAQNSHQMNIPSRMGSLEDSFTFQNDITERPSEQFGKDWFRPSQTRQNPFTQHPNRSEPKDQESASRTLPQCASVTMPGEVPPLNCPPLLLNTLDPPRGGRDSMYNDILVVQGSFQSQQLEHSPQKQSDCMKISERSFAQVQCQPKEFASAASDLVGRPGPNAKVGSGAIPSKSNQHLSDGFFMDNFANCGPGVLNVSTISMEFATHTTKRSGQQQQHKQVVNGQAIGSGVTITSMEDQILEKEYENEQLRQLGFFAESNRQSPALFGALDAPLQFEDVHMKRRQGFTAQPSKHQLFLGGQRDDYGDGLSSLAQGKDDRMFQISSVQQLPHAQPSLPEQLGAPGLPAAPRRDNADASQSKTSVPLQGTSKVLELQNQERVKQILELGSKIITPEPKYQQNIFKSTMEGEEQQIPSSARATAVGFIAAAGFPNSEKRHSHTQAKLDQRHIQRIADKNRDLSADDGSIVSLTNLYNAATSGTKTAMQKNAFGQKFKEMLNLAEVRKVSKERRNTHELVKGLAANLRNLKDVHMVSQRQLSNQILIVDAAGQESSKRGPRTDNRCSPVAADLSDSEGSLHGTPSRENVFKLGNHNEVYKVRSHRSKHRAERDESSQRLQQFVADNNKKLEEILKMAEKIEMRSIENQDQESSSEQRRSRSRRKRSLNRTENLRRKQKDQLSQMDLSAGSKQVKSPRQIQITLAGPRSWAERGNLQASSGDVAEKQT